MLCFNCFFVWQGSVIWIETSLDADLPVSYDKETFAAKINLLLTHFIDMAVQGYGWVAA